MSNTEASSAKASASGKGKAKAPEQLLAFYQAESIPDPNSKLAWYANPPGTTKGLSDFLEKHAPSKTRSIGKERYIFVCSGRNGRRGESSEASETALAQAHATLADVKAQCEAIDADERVPLRQSKAKGRSKAQKKATLTSQLKDDVLPNLAKEGGLTSGKWLFFKNETYVDSVFRLLSWSIVNGPLSKLKKANCHTVKVSTNDNMRDGEHMIALFFENVWDREAAREVAETLVRHHSQFSRACKTDLWTALGIDSKHWSEIPSSIYSYDMLIPPDVQNELKDAYATDKAEREAQAKSKGSRGHGQGGSRASMARRDEGSGQADNKRDSSSSSTVRAHPVKPSVYWPNSDDDKGSASLSQDQDTAEQGNDGDSLPEKDTRQDRQAQQPTADLEVDSSDTESEEEMLGGSSRQKKATTTHMEDTQKQSDATASKVTNDSYRPPKRERPVDDTSASGPALRAPRPTTAAQMASLKKARASRSGF